MVYEDIGKNCIFNQSNGLKTPHVGSIGEGMNFGETDEQEMIRELVRDLPKRAAPMAEQS